MTLSVWFAFTLAISQAHAVAPLPTQFVLDFWSTKAGLPEETIYAVTQTGDGYLWLGTANGLVRYDGNSFYVRQPREDLGATFVPAASRIPLNNKQFVFKQEILRIMPGPRHSLWAYSSSYGLLRYEGRAFRAGPEYPRPCGFVDLKEDRDGTLLICNERVLRIADDKIDELVTLPSGSLLGIRAAARDENGKLWIGLAEGGVAELRADGSLSTRYGTKEGIPGPVNCLLFGGPGSLCVGTNSGLALVHGGRVKLYTTSDGLSSARIGRLTLGRGGTLWVGTSAGLSLYRDGNFVNFGAVPGLPSPSSVRAILVDREDSVWVTFSDTGLFRLRKPKFLTWGKPEGLVNQNAKAVLQSGGTVWIAHTGGLQAIEEGKLGPPVAGLGNLPIQYLEEDGERRIWAFSSAAAFIVEPRTGKTKKVVLPSGVHQILSADSDRGGHIWLVTDGGLFVNEGDQVRAVHLAGLPSQLHRPIVRQSADGRRWLSLSTEGLFELRNGVAVRVFLGPDRDLVMIHTFYIAANNDFWFGLDGGGLARWRDGKVSRYGNETGRPHNFVYNFAEDTEGYFWMGLRAGLIRISKAELNEYLDGKRKRAPTEQYYDIGDGLRSTNFGISNRTDPPNKASRILWFGNLLGVLRIDTSDIPLNSVKPPVHMEEVAADNRVLPMGESVTFPAGTGVLRFRF